MTFFEKSKFFIKFALRDIECGHHSGFRPCCIFCYAILDNLSSCGQKKFHDRRRYLNRLVVAFRGLEFGYIPCPLCWFRSPIVVRSCQNNRQPHYFNFTSRKDVDKFINSRGITKLYRNFRKIDRLLRLIKIELPED